MERKWLQVTHRFGLVIELRAEGVIWDLLKLDATSCQEKTRHRLTPESPLNHQSAPYKEKQSENMKKNQQIFIPTFSLPDL
eukprot:4402335-Amphidinium_carterae.1